MLELLSAYNLSEIIIFTVMLAAAIKSVTTFWDWAKDRLRKMFKKENQAETWKNQIESRLDKYDEAIGKVAENQEKYNELIEKIENKVDILIGSDKDDIKSWITKEHHYFCYQVKWIDDYSLDCIEKRFGHYQDEGGNSFIEELMAEIRALPKVPPQE